MIVGVCWVDLHVLGARSLKDKRRIIKSIKERIRGSYNVSAAEVGSLDIWQRAELGFACVGNEQARIQHTLSTLIDRFRMDPDVSLIDYTIEIM